MQSKAQQKPAFILNSKIGGQRTEWGIVLEPRVLITANDTLIAEHSMFRVECSKFAPMSWISLSICSALFLGFYDLAKKHALKDNAVFPVLFFGIVTSACVWHYADKNQTLIQP